MWSGIGIGLGGLATLGTGLGLSLKNEPIKVNYLNTENYKSDQNLYNYLKDKKLVESYTHNNQYKLGICLIGVGGTLVIGGVLLTAIFGYRYNHSDNYSFGISPDGTGLTFSF